MSNCSLKCAGQFQIAEGDSNIVDRHGEHGKHVSGSDDRVEHGGQHRETSDNSAEGTGGDAAEEIISLAS